ncbi:MAG: hypothetical protein M0R74_05590 [Dehalococcoidia bacterium]|nr:hypothetical protein [Dehalococcoidia bacterium]
MPAPSYPRPGLLPWILGAVAAAALVWGLLDGDRGLIGLGILGLVVGIVAFGISRALLGSDAGEDEQDGGGT